MKQNGCLYEDIHNGMPTAKATASQYLKVCTSYKKDNR